MNPEKSHNLRWAVIGIAGGIVLCCIAGALLGYHFISHSAAILKTSLRPTLVEVTMQPAGQVPTGSALPPASGDEVGEKTLEAIESAIVPPVDPVLTSYRLGRIKSLSRQKMEPPENYSVGDEEDFWVLDQQTSKVTKKTAVLRRITAHAYFWIQAGKDYRESDLDSLADAFENEIYPKSRSFFGSEWSPGVDNDEHIYIFYTDGVGEGIAGLFSSEDSFLDSIDPYSNEHEMFYLSSHQQLSDKYAYGVLAHEFNHMILWNQDSNEDTWLAEGLADFSVLLNGYDAGGFDALFAKDPDLQLNTWPEESSDQDAHYGSSFLFVLYLYSRFGEKIIQQIMQLPQNGLDGIDAALKNLGPEADQGVLDAEQVFGDWAVANYLNDPAIDRGQYSYQSGLSIPKFSDTETLSCPQDWQTRQVNQFGTDYIRMNCSGSYQLEFQGEPSVDLVSEPERGPNQFFWSNRADSSEMTLTQNFDFSSVSEPLWLNYRTWYKIEQDYDFAYLMVKEEGQPWKIIQTPSCTSDNPTGANLGCGYTGDSGSWLEEKVDLSEYMGKKVTLQFTYITDSGVNTDGMLLDDISIPAIGYSTNLETDNGGWIPEGWVRGENEIPQSFQVSIIHLGTHPTVDRYSVSSGQKLNIPLRFDSDEGVEFVVSGTTRDATTPAAYQFRALPAP